MSEKKNVEVMDNLRVRLPKEFADALKIAAGDTVIMEMVEGKILIVPAVVIPREKVR